MIIKSVLGKTTCAPQIIFADVSNLSANLDSKRNYEKDLKQNRAKVSRIWFYEKDLKQNQAKVSRIWFYEKDSKPDRAKVSRIWFYEKAAELDQISAHQFISTNY